MKKILNFSIVFFFFLLLGTELSAQKFDKQINSLAIKYEKEMIELRHWFHQNAELSNREFKTADRIAEELKRRQVAAIAYQC